MAESFSAAYAAALRAYVRAPGETSLRVAYELGRDAVTRRIGMLELALAHQDALLAMLDPRAPADEALAGVARTEDPVAAVARAGDFFLESLSSFEMVQRGLDEAREARWRDRRQTELSRQLSSFLADTSLAVDADASLALDADASLAEIVRLVAEHARELGGAPCCLTTVSRGGEPRALEAVSHPEPGLRWRALVRWIDLAAADALVRRGGGSMRLAGAEIARLPRVQRANVGPPLRSWLAASLTALDGGAIGTIHLFDKHDGEFTADDEATLVQLAQMTSATLDRVGRYGSQRT